MPNPIRRYIRLLLALALLCLGFAAPLPAAHAVEVDPPGRVGRIADLQGQVWLYRTDAGDWIDAERNQPLTGGDRLATDPGARAEIRIGSTTLRLDGGSEVEVLRLDDDLVSLQLHNGNVTARLRSDETLREFELRTGEGRFTAQRVGRYRLDRANDASHFTVYNGMGLYEGPGSALTVNAGQQAEFWIDAANVAQYRIVEPSRDAFAAWNAERDRADDRSSTTRYVSSEMTGVEDLDRYGAWESNEDYGSLWVPRNVAPGWAPYGVGHWAWVAPWGWTWVDDAPWGFAPFHYGRWVYLRERWCWSPGTYVRRPVYAPALVAWIGGPRLSVAVNVGNAPTIGWLPLAPREVFVPGYRVSPGYVRNVNITHVTNITNITTIVNNPQQAAGDREFRNRHAPNAVTLVPSQVLSTRQPVASAALRDPARLREFVAQPPRAAALAAPPAAIAPAPAPARTPGIATLRRIESRPPPAEAEPAPPRGVVAPRGAVTTREPPPRPAVAPGPAPTPAPQATTPSPRPMPPMQPAPAPQPPKVATPPVRPPATPVPPAAPPAVHTPPKPAPEQRPTTAPGLETLRRVETPQPRPPQREPERRSPTERMRAD